MAEKVKITDPSACVHCHKCRRNCLFLEKYGIDIGDAERLAELAYHCFLCGRCTAVCPKGIDGREIVLGMRRSRVRKHRGKLCEKGYRVLRLEKENYIFRNYRNAEAKSVLFPGCSFPAYYPQTTTYLTELLREKAGMGVAFDCCGKPIAELGMELQEQRIIAGIENRLRACGAEEVVVVCPNCYHFLKPRLKINVVGIYEKLYALGIGKTIEEKITFFPPCPDRENGELLAEIGAFLKEEPEIISHVQCCGLGGCVWKKEHDLAERMVGDIGREKKKIHTYCASCSGNFVRNGYHDSAHILLEILGREEQPNTGKSVSNRLKMKYLRMPAGK